jgi:hypothetical protein
MQLNNIQTFGELCEYVDDVIKLLELCYNNRTHEMLIINGVVNVGGYNNGIDYRFSLFGQEFGAYCFYNLDPDDYSWVNITEWNRIDYYIFRQENIDFFEMTMFEKPKTTVLGKEKCEFDFLNLSSCTEEMYEQLQYLHDPEIVKFIMIMSLFYIKGHKQFAFYDHTNCDPKKMYDAIKDMINEFPCNKVISG